MKNFYFLPAILSLLLLSPAVTRADDGEIVYDVSGDKGSDGRPGNKGAISQRNRADDGSAGENGEPGDAAGVIEAEIGFVPGSDDKEIYIKGFKKESRSNQPSSFEEHLSASSLKSMRFLANGGSGGSGGRGGDGDRGENGDNGSNRTSTFGWGDLNGGAGQDGEASGYGGNGGAAGRGGDAGSVKIKLAPGAELLAPFIRVEAKPGRAGYEGQGGNPGAVSKGGSGGHGICEDGTLPDIYTFNNEKTYTNDAGKVVKRVRCGSRGTDGRPGQPGNRGNNGVAASNGAKGVEVYAYSDGKSVNGGYELRAANWVIDESVKDGVVEPKEDLRARGVVFENTGKDPVPAANYNLALPDGKSVTVAMDALPAGAKREVKLDNPVVIEAPASGNAVIPLGVTLNHLDPSVKPAPTLPVQQPVEVTEVSGLDLTSKKREGEISIRVVNHSNKSYGAQGEIARALKVQLQSKSVNPPLVKVDGKFMPLNRALDLEIPKIGPGEARTLKVKVRVPENWKPGQDARLGSTLTIENSKVAPEMGGLMQIAYKIDRNDKIVKNFSVKDLGVTCQYYRALWFNYAVDSVSVVKEENSEYVDVRVQLDGGKTSPVYKIALAKIPPGFLDNVLNERPFTSNQMVDFLQTLEHPGYRGVLSDGSKWNVRSCYAAENRTGQVDPESYAAQQASRINTVNDSDGDHDSRVIQQFVNQKRDDRHNPIDDAREEKKSQDAR